MVEWLCDVRGLGTNSFSKIIFYLTYLIKNKKLQKFVKYFKKQIYKHMWPNSMEMCLFCGITTDPQVEKAFGTSYDILTL